MLLLILLFLSLAAAHAQTPSLPPGYVGSNVCKSCHPDVWLNFFKNPHYKSIASGEEPPDRTGCEACHGPGKAHVEARGGKTTIPRAFSLMDTKRTMDTCLTCHGKDFGKINIRRSSHSMADVACTSCHSIHKSAVPIHLLAKKQSDLCYTCHLDVRSQFSMPFKHRVNEGVVQCADCHNPHGTTAPTWRMARPHMVQQALGNETPCVKCHTDKRGPWVFEHATLRVEGCETCHQPHGSMNAKLLRRPVVFTLCMECHNDPDLSSGTGSGVPSQTASHNMADPHYRNCTACHVRIHGSNADQNFLR